MTTSQEEKFRARGMKGKKTGRSVFHYLIFPPIIR